LLLVGLKTNAVLADKAYDANDLVEYIRAGNAQAVIPPNRNRLEQRKYDRH
jgi:hypothetical protein